MHYRSIAVWPRHVGINLGTSDNSSSDTHATAEQAWAVCQLLRDRGFGGDGLIFPASVQVEFAPLPDEIVYDPTDRGRDRYTHGPSGRAVVRQPFASGRQLS